MTNRGYDVVVDVDDEVCTSHYIYCHLLVIVVDK
jgi:hypothetical protein